MTGKTHLRVGVLAYLIVILSGISVILPFITTGTDITLAGVFTAGIAALIPDMDTKRSKVNQYNLILQASNKLFETIEKWVLFGVRLILTLGTGVILIKFSGNIGAFFEGTQIKFIRGISSTWVIVVASLIMLVGVLNNKLVKNIPVIGHVYGMLETGIDKISNILKDIAYKLIYIGSAVGLGIYNYYHGNHFSVYLFGVILIAVCIFPHRTFTHSLFEGLIVIGFVAYQAAFVLGYPYLGWCFIIGLLSHILLTDGLTKEGIYITIIHKILDKLLIGKLLDNMKWYAKFEEWLDKHKVRFPLMSTGSKWGNIFETGYVLILAGLVVFLYVQNGVGFRII